MAVLDVIQSVTWPFEEFHPEIPQGLFVDAHVVSADSCVLNSVLISSGSIFVSLTVTFNNVTTEVSSGSVPLYRNSKIEFSNAVGKCFGWLLTGDILPERFILQNVSYALAGDACLPVEGYTPANTSGMTGDWEIVGEDGIAVEPEFNENTGILNLSFSTDSEWYTVEDPNYTQKAEGEGIWSINGLSGDIKFRLDNGAIFPEFLEDSDYILNMEFVPDLVFFSDAVDGSSKNHYTFSVGANDHSWSGTEGTVSFADGTFTVTVNNTARTMKLNETVVRTVSGVKRLERLAIRWAGCPDNDPLREKMKTSKELASDVPFPLDSILNGG